MLRLAHRALTQKTVIPNVVIIEAHRPYLGKYELFKKMLGSSMCQIIIADSVAKYYASTPKQEWGLAPKNYPNISPLFETGWFIEYKDPEYLVKPKGKIEFTGSRHQQAGALFVNAPIESARELCMNYGAKINELAPYLDKARWFYLVQYIGTLPNGQVVYMPHVNGIFVAPSGEFIKSVFMSDCINVMEMNMPEYAGQMEYNLHIPLFAMGFINRGEADYVDVTKEEGPSEKWCRRQGVPQKSYQAIVIRMPSVN